MRNILLAAILFSVSAINAQTGVPVGLLPYELQPAGYLNNMQSFNNLPEKKWSFTRFNAISTSFMFFNGGNASVISAPIVFQLNRKLNKNLYAFANVSAVPAYVNFNSSFLNPNTKTGQKNGLMNGRGFSMGTRASLGLMYINEEKTFSVSGSISVEQSTYPVLPYYGPSVHKLTPPSSIR